MNTRLKASIEDAIQKVMNKAAEDDSSLWDHYIHPQLVKQMTNAAEVVFDSSADSQTYFEQETR